MATPQEIYEHLSFDSLDRAYREGMNFSTWLEEQDPTSEYASTDEGSKLDAFERQLATAGIRTKSSRAHGFYADKLDKFDDTPQGRVLLSEWMVREYRKATAANRSIISSDMSQVGSAMRPYITAAGARVEELQAAIPISELVALTTPIQGDVYRAMYMNDDVQEYRMVRVGETAEIPAVRLTAGETAIRLYKYGRRLDISYEAMRRLPIDTVAFWIARMAIQAEVDKLSTVIDVMVNGDGNPNTQAEVIDLDTLDPAASTGTLTLKGWLAFKLQFKNPYTLTTELLQTDLLLQQQLLNTGSANIPLMMIPGTGFGGFSPINDRLSDTVRYGHIDEAPTGKIIGFDNRFAIQQVTEVGATINETQRWITKQVETMTFTETEGYAVIDDDAVKILNVAFS